MTFSTVCVCVWECACVIGGGGGGAVYVDTVPPFIE